MIILGGDPGSKNFAVSIVEFHNRKLTCLGSKMLVNTLHKYDDTMPDQFSAFIREIADIRDTFKPDAAIMERYQTRGNGGNTIEFVSMMNALMFRTIRRSSPVLVTASTWKNAATRAGIDLKALYLEYKMTSVYCPKTIHEFDATMMAVFRLYKVLDVTPFSNFDVHAFITKFHESPNL
jgi:Holliday junction resolvasome RuvABC endonuclease subunit